MALTRGRLNNCDNLCAGGMGGKIYVHPAKYHIDTNFDANGKVSGYVFDFGTSGEVEGWAVYDFTDFTAKFTENGNIVNGCNRFYDQKIEFTWSCPTHDDKLIIDELAKESCCGLIIIHIDSTGNAWTWGFVDKQRAKLTTTVLDTGATLEDPSQIVLSFETKSIQQALGYSGDVSSLPTL